jgi:AcrR family transcriptional regulator
MVQSNIYKHFSDKYELLNIYFVRAIKATTLSRFSTCSKDELQVT